MYLVYTEYTAHCVNNVILGVCENMREVTGVIWTFSRFYLKIYDQTFEECNDLIYIAKISEDFYDILKKLEKKYNDKYDSYIEHYFPKWINDPDEMVTEFWYGTFKYEEEKGILFSKEDCELIEKIIEESETLE